MSNLILTVSNLFLCVSSVVADYFLVIAFSFLPLQLTVCEGDVCKDFGCVNRLKFKLLNLKCYGIYGAVGYVCGWCHPIYESKILLLIHVNLLVLQSQNLVISMINMYCVE